jgi:hypothetical protein
MRYYQATVMVPIQQEFRAENVAQAQAMARALAEQMSKPGGPQPFLHTLLELKVPEAKSA